MFESAIRQLEDLSRAGPSVAPLARLQAAVLRAAGDPDWEEGVPTLAADHLPAGQPLLQGQVLRVARPRARDLLGRMVDVMAPVAIPGAELRRQIREPATLDPLALLEASIAQDNERLDALAVAAGVDAALLATLGQLAALPLLLACGRRATGIREGLRWEAGYCPVCGAWPALAEVRSTERQRWLRCGRCDCAWEHPHLFCPFCGNGDHRTQGYLASESGRASRRVATCDRCRGYLKVLATLTPLAPAEVVVRDLATVELDVAALERDYVRPAVPGFALQVRVVPYPSRAATWQWRGS